MEIKPILAALVAIGIAGMSAKADETQPLDGWELSRASRGAYQAQVGVRVAGFWGEKYKLLVCKWIPHCI